MAGLFFRIYGFILAAVVYLGTVDIVAKGLLSAISVTRPDLINGLYDWNQAMIRGIPGIGEYLVALVRTWAADGSIVAFEAYLVGGVPLFILVALFRPRHKHERREKPEPTPTAS